MYRCYVTAALKLPVLQESEPLLDELRPRTRGDCIDGLRPCPWVGCRHNLFLNVDRSGNVELAFGEDPTEAPHSLCALDNATGLPSVEIGALMGLSTTSVVQIELKALRKIGSNRKGAFKEFHGSETPVCHWDAMDLMSDEA